MISLTALCLATAPVAAQEHPPTPASTVGEPGTHAGSGAHEAHGEGYAKNGLALVLGGTYESQESRTLFTFGFEYERLFHPRLAVVLRAEYVTKVDAFLLVAPVVYRHPSGLRLLTGPGLELIARRPQWEEDVDLVPEEEKNLLFWRFGGGYDFPISERHSIAPAVGLDFVRQDGRWVWAVVATVTIGVDF